MIDTGRTENGWDIYIRFDLHAKTYIVDNKRCLVGSANATNSGLNIGKVGNMEMAVFVDVEPDDIFKINGLFNDAILVDKSLVKEMNNQLQLVPKSGKKDTYRWDDGITKRFKPHIDTLFSYELPDDNKLEVGAFYSFLDLVYTGDIKRFRETLRWSNSYMWLMNVLKDKEGEIYFGKLTEKLHNCLVTDPKPYRKDVRQMISNLLDLIIAVEMEEIVIDRPRYSQRVRLIVEE